MKTIHPILKLSYALFLFAAITAGSTQRVQAGITDPLQSHDIVLEDSVYVVVDQMPEFQGGRRGLADFINKNLRYPTEAKRLNIKGKVYVKFIVNTDGQVMNVDLVRKGNPILDAEALRVVRSMPNWKPGVHKGSNVNVSLIVTVSFPPMR